MIDQLHGRMVDLDSHLTVAPGSLAEILGPLATDDFMLAHGRRLFAPGVELVRATSADDVWKIKGQLAAGGGDPVERLRCMDLMGIHRQLVLPNTGLRELLEPGPEPLAAARRYNDYAIAWGKQTRGRCAMAVELNMHEVDAALAEIRRVLAAGAEAVLLGCAEPPAGVSPAAPEWDPLWAQLAEAHVPAILHFGSAGVRGRREFPDPRWSPDDVDQRGRATGDRLVTFRVATALLGAQVYLDAMILGGVFEHHPDLRVGLIELTAGWVAPWCRHLDRVTEWYGAQTQVPLSLKPSEHVRRQVRVTHGYGEPVGGYIEQDGFAELYAFSTDFPHAEGGTDPVQRFHASLSPLGPFAIEQYFVENGAALLRAQWTI